MKNKAGIFLVFFLFIFINCGGYNKVSTLDTAKVFSRSVNLILIESGTYSGYNGEKILLEVIEDKKKFNDLYKTIHSINLPVREPPEIDFNANFILAAFLGKKPTGGYSIEFVDAQLNDTSRLLYVRVLTKEPPSGSILTQALTSPYALASVKRGKIEEIVFLNKNGDILKKVQFH